jgi:hypothetical protein
MIHFEAFAHALHNDTHRVRVGMVVDLIEAIHQQSVIASPQTKVVLQVRDQLPAQLVERLVAHVAHGIHLLGRQIGYQYVDSLVDSPWQSESLKTVNHSWF